MRDDKGRQIAVLDIGSNSVRLVIYQLSGLSFTQIFNEKVLAGLGRGIRESGRLSVAGKAQTLSALKRFSILIEGLGLKTVLIAATAALRVAQDAPQFIALIKEETGFEITPLLGEEEAYYAALGVLAGEPRAVGVCADLGGASLEITPIENQEPKPGVSLPLGPFAVYQGAFNAARARAVIRKEGSKLQSDYKADQLYLIGGAWRNLALIHQARTSYPLKVVQNYRWDYATAQEIAQWGYSKAGQEVLCTWPGLKPQRADTLAYSCLMLDELLRMIKPKCVIIAPGGVRDGLVLSTFSKAASREDALLDACQDLAQGNREGAVFGAPLFAFVSKAAMRFPTAFLPDNENRLRRAACDLVGIGKGLHPDHKAKMMFRTVLYAPLPGLTHKERAYLALMLFASYTTKNNTPNQDAIEYLLNPDEKKSARLYGYAMRLGVTLSARSAIVLSAVDLSKHGNTLALKMPRDKSALGNDRIELRLQQIATVLDCDAKISYF